MAVHLTAMTVIHLLFAALWAGAVVFMSYGVLPSIGSANTNGTALAGLVGRLTTLSRVSAVLLLVTGGAMAGEEYGGGRLLGTTDGWLVLLMVGLWLVLAALVEVGASRVTDQLETAGGVSSGEIRLFRVAAVVAVGLLLIGGFLSA